MKVTEINRSGCVYCSLSEVIEMASFWDRVLGKDNVDVNSESYLDGKKQEFSRQRQAYRRMQAEGKMYNVDAALRALDEREQQIDRRMRELEDQGTTYNHHGSGEQRFYSNTRSINFSGGNIQVDGDEVTPEEFGSSTRSTGSNVYDDIYDEIGRRMAKGAKSPREAIDQIRAQMWDGNLPEDRDAGKPKTQYNNYGGGVQINVNRWGDQNIVRGNRSKWD